MLYTKNTRGKRFSKHTLRKKKKKSFTHRKGGLLYENNGNVKPCINLIAVWNELEKENKEFFETYAQSQRQSTADIMSEEEITRLIQKIISDSSKDSDD